MPNNVLVFDADDTLWMNEWQYSHAKTKFFLFLYEIFGHMTPNLHVLKDRYFEISKSLYPKYGTKRGRVSEAMLIMYQELCEWAHWRFGVNRYHESHKQIIGGIGDLPFDFTRLQMLPQTKTTLAQLKQQGHRLCLLSSYDPEVFPKRAEFLGVYDYFHPQNVYATELRKTREDFIKVSGWTEANDRDHMWYTIGNGEGDILPALEISERWQGIYIPHGSTALYVGHTSGTNVFTPPP